MAAIKLDIRDSGDSRKVVKTLETEGYNLMMGTVDDFMEIFDLDQLSDQKAILKMIQKSYKQIKPLIMDIFPELTEEDYRNVSVQDLARTVVQVGTSIIDNINITKN